MTNPLASQNCNTMTQLSPQLKLTPHFAITSRIDSPFCLLSAGAATFVSGVRGAIQSSKPQNFSRYQSTYPILPNWHTLCRPIHEIRNTGSRKKIASRSAPPERGSKTAGPVVINNTTHIFPCYRIHPMLQDTTVKFEKPDIDSLKREHTVVDMHYHTQYSDGQNTVPQIVRRARELGIGVAITDHNEIKGALEIDAYKDLLTIPGIEITSREGTHLLVYFYETSDLKTFYENDIRPYMGPHIMSSTKLSIETIIEKARRFRTVIIFPHPYSAVYTGICNFYFSEVRLNEIFKKVDGVEAINGENLNKWNLKSTVLGFNIEKSMTGGSDGHKIQHMGSAVSYAKCPGDRAAFLNAVKNRRAKVMGKEIAMLKKVTSNSAKLRTNINNYPDIIEKNMRYGYVVLHTKSKKMQKNLKSRLDKDFRSALLRFVFNGTWFRHSHNLTVLLCIAPMLM